MSLSAAQIMLCSAPRIEIVSIRGAERPAPHDTVHVRLLVDRRAPQVRAGAPAAHALLPADRPHIPCDPLRAMTAVHCALLASDFTHPTFVPADDIFVDFSSGCPNPCCTDDCEMIHSFAPALTLPLCFPSSAAPAAAAAYAHARCAIGSTATSRSHRFWDPRESLNKSYPTGDIKAFFTPLPRVPGQPKPRMSCNLCL